MKMNEKSTIYWTLDVTEDDFNIKSNERVMTMILTDIMLMMTSLWMFKRWLMTFILNIQENCTRNNIHVNMNSWERKIILQF